MAEYLIQDTTLTNLADKIRVLSGTEDALTPSQMTSNVQSANDEVDAQSALIDQLSAALEGKAGGSGSGGGSVGSCTVEISTSEGVINDSTYSCVIDGVLTSVNTNGNNAKSVVLNDVVCGSFVCLSMSSTMISAEVASGVEVLGNNTSLWKVTAGDGETAILKFYNPF